MNAALCLATNLPGKKKKKNDVPILPSFDDPKYFDAIDRNNASKVLSHMFRWKLVKDVSAEDVIISLSDPGIVKGTDLTRDAKGGQMVAAALFGAIAGGTKDVGATTYLDAILNKESESNGCFVLSWQVHP